MRSEYNSVSSRESRLAAISLRALDILLIKNPERTAIGLIFGLALQGAFNVFSPLFAKAGILLGPFDWWASICLGIALVHLPFIVWSVHHKPLISDELENLMELIESTNIGEAEKRSAYRRVVNKCIDQFALSSKPGKINEILGSEVEDVRSETE